MGRCTELDTDANMAVCTSAWWQHKCGQRVRMCEHEAKKRCKPGQGGGKVLESLALTLTRACLFVPASDVMTNAGGQHWNARGRGRADGVCVEAACLGRPTPGADGRFYPTALIPGTHLCLETKLNFSTPVPPLGGPAGVIMLRQAIPPFKGVIACTRSGPSTPLLPCAAPFPSSRASGCCIPRAALGS